MNEEREEEKFPLISRCLRRFTMKEERREREKNNEERERNGATTRGKERETARDESERWRGRVALSGIFTGIRDGIVACPVPMRP